MAKIDWDYWRLKFVSGDDSVTLRALSEIQNAPAYISLRKRSSKESWDEQRKRFRYERDTKVIQAATSESAVSRVEKFVDSAEMMTRHLGAARMIGSKALQAFKMMPPEKIKPSEAVAMMKLAVEIERITEGLATERQETNIGFNTPINIRVVGGEGSDS